MMPYAPEELPGSSPINIFVITVDNLARHG
jgi:hypothetical protein